MVALSMSETEFVNNFGNLLSFVNLEVSKWLFVAAKKTIKLLVLYYKLDTIFISHLSIKEN